MNLIDTHWKKFRDSLKGKLEAANKADLKNAWNSQPERTDFYTSKLLPKVAEDLTICYRKPKTEKRKLYL